MTTYTEAQLVNVDWKPCSKSCIDYGIDSPKFYVKRNNSSLQDVCTHCSGTGKEPVEMTNSICEKECDGKGYITTKFNKKGIPISQIDCKDCKGTGYKHQVGVEFEVECSCEIWGWSMIKRWI